jgi:hypothetical protein
MDMPSLKEVREKRPPARLYPVKFKSPFQHSVGGGRVYSIHLVRQRKVMKEGQETTPRDDFGKSHDARLPRPGVVVAQMDSCVYLGLLGLLGVLPVLPPAVQELRGSGQS